MSNFASDLNKCICPECGATLNGNDKYPNEIACPKCEFHISMELYHDVIEASFPPENISVDDPDKNLAQLSDL